MARSAASTACAWPTRWPRTTPSSRDALLSFNKSVNPAGWQALQPAPSQAGHALVATGRALRIRTAKSARLILIKARSDQGGVLVGHIFRRDSMTGVRINRKTGAGSWRWLRWFMVSLILLSLGLATIQMADAHPVQHHSDHGLAATLSDVAPGSPQCCDDADPGHAAGACSNSGHCFACATSTAGALAPALSPEACLDPRLIVLPAGLTSDPAGRPPKSV